MGNPLLALGERIGHSLGALAGKAGPSPKGAGDMQDVEGAVGSDDALYIPAIFSD